MSIEKCHAIIKEYFSEYDLIEPIGNHHLGRHYVFKVDSDKSYVMKFYFKEHKWEREVSSLALLSNTSFKTPKIIDYGITESVEWILYEYTKGQTLCDLTLSDDELESIYYSLGEEVAKIHENFQFDRFGRLDLFGDFYVENDTNEEYIRYIYESTLRNLSEVNHERQDLIDRATIKLKRDISNLQINEPGCLCHNDVSDRNIIVKDGKFELLIDFEQASITDRYRELALIRYYLLKDGKNYFTFFLQGYKKNYPIDLEILNQRSNTYLLLYGIMICSWSLNVNKEYYEEGIAILEKYC